MAHQILTVDLLPEAVQEFDRHLEETVSTKKQDPVVATNQAAIAEFRRMGVPIPVIRR